MINKHSFKKNFDQNLGKVIVISDQDISRISTWANDIAKVKTAETGYKNDSNKIRKRYYTGMLGEVALEYLLDTKFIDWDIGESKFYNDPDLRALGDPFSTIGIKTVEKGNFPLVKKNPPGPEIINVKINNNEICVLGLVDVESLKTYTDDTLIIDPRVKAKGQKTGYWNLKAAIPFDSLETLKDALNFSSCIKNKMCDFIAKSRYSLIYDQSIDWDMYD
tara:strand:+ start:77 stop:736 length:660 start_codon:yes stop_codon:yes gene_type:complete